MTNIFKNTNAYWAKYSDYEYKTDENGDIYLTPTQDAMPTVCDPIKSVESLVIDAINVGRLAMKQDDESKNKFRESILEFTMNYGLLGFISAIPTTPNFTEYDAVYLPKNHFIKEETLSTEEYLSLFFPFEKPEIYKDENQYQLDFDANTPRERRISALLLSFANEPTALNMSFLPHYAERLDWLITQFRDWAFMLVSAFLYYESGESTDDFTKNIYRQGVSSFGNKAPTYRMKLYDDKPTIVWDFYSLLLTIQTMFGFAMTDEANPIRLCEACGFAFIAKRKDTTQRRTLCRKCK